MSGRAGQWRLRSAADRRIGAPGQSRPAAQGHSGDIECELNRELERSARMKDWRRGRSVFSLQVSRIDAAAAANVHTCLRKRVRGSRAWCADAAAAENPWSRGRRQLRQHASAVLATTGGSMAATGQRRCAHAEAPAPRTSDVHSFHADMQRPSFTASQGSAAARSARPEGRRPTGMRTTQACRSGARPRLATRLAARSVAHFAGSRGSTRAARGGTSSAQNAPALLKRQSPSAQGPKDEAAATREAQTPPPARASSVTLLDAAFDAKAPRRGAAAPGTRGQGSQAPCKAVHGAHFRLDAWQAAYRATRRRVARRARVA